MASKKDTVAKQFTAREDIFADIVNYTVYHGRQKIKPEDLKPMDATELISWNDEKQQVHFVQKYRDVLKKCVIKTTDEMSYIIVGIEDQTEVHYGMVVRNMLYDALNYAAQAEVLERKNKKEKILKDSREFLSGLRKSDRLKPVITITVFWSGDYWDGARSLKELLDIPDENVGELVNDYQLNLLIPKEVVSSRLHSDMSIVMEALACSNDEKELERLIYSSDRYQNIDNELANVLCTFTDMKKPRSRKGKVNMCKAIEDMKRRVERETTERVEKETTERMEKNMCKAIEDMKRRVERETTERVEKETTERVEREIIRKILETHVKKGIMTVEQALAELKEYQISDVNL